MITEILNRIQKWAEESIVDEIIIFALLIAFFEGIAQNKIKNADHNDSTDMAIGLLVYACVGYILHYAYHRYPISKINVVWSCVSIILAVAIGYWFYDEPITKWTIVALILALAAVYVINL